MTRCKEAYLKWREVRETQGEVCDLKRGKSVKYQISAYDALVSTFVERGLSEDAIYCNFTESAARPLFEEDDGEIREAAIDKIVERIKEGKRTTDKDTKAILRELRGGRVVRAKMSAKYDHVSLYEGDMLEVLPKLDKFELILTDPPYGVTKNEWDTLNTEAWIDAVIPHLADKYTIFWFCSPRFAADIEMVFRTRELPVQSRIVWHRRNMSMGSHSRGKFIDTWDMIFHIGNRELNFPSKWTEAWFDVQIFAAPQTNFEDKKYHVTQKPKDLMERLVEFGSYPDDRILDPFAGSGTTGAVCRNDRTCALIESEQKYVDIIEQRLGVKRWME
jgi:16S rRNA G966 N2-methylase RsmD